MVTVGVATAAAESGRVLLEIEFPPPPLLVDPPLFYPGVVGLVVGVELPPEAGGIELVELEIPVSVPPLDDVSPLLGTGC